MIAILENKKDIKYTEVKSKLLFEFNKRKVTNKERKLYPQNQTAFMAQKCLTCGDSRHLQKDCPKNYQRQIRGSLRGQFNQMRLNPTSQEKGNFNYAQNGSKYSTGQYNQSRGHYIWRTFSPKLLERITTNPDSS